MEQNSKNRRRVAKVGLEVVLSRFAVIEDIIIALLRA